LPTSNGKDAGNSRVAPGTRASWIVTSRASSLPLLSSRNAISSFVPASTATPGVPTSISTRPSSFAAGSHEYAAKQGCRKQHGTELSRAGKPRLLNFIQDPLFSRRMLSAKVFC
jgi:hypothetical protein